MLIIIIILYFQDRVNIPLQQQIISEDLSIESKKKLLNSYPFSASIFLVIIYNVI